MVIGNKTYIHFFNQHPSDWNLPQILDFSTFRSVVYIVESESEQISTYCNLLLTIVVTVPTLDIPYKCPNLHNTRNYRESAQLPVLDKLLKKL